MNDLREWQFIGDDQWVFGVKVRGVVRQRHAEVYFDEDYESPEGGWIWMTFSRTEHGLARASMGVSANLSFAVRAAEIALGIEQEENA